MNIFKRTFIAAVAPALFLFPQTAHAQDYLALVSEDFLRSTFVFTDNDNLKYADCKKETIMTCAYVWGPPDRRDEARASAGLRPDGATLQTLFVQTRGMQDFERSISYYPDARGVDNLAQAAVWSAQRGQLTLLTDSNLLIHVHVGGMAGAEALAVTVAEHLLSGL